MEQPARPGCQGPEDHPGSPEVTAKLKRFHEEGLLWLINTAILHPRGMALVLHTGDEGPMFLTVADFGEYTTFVPRETEDVARRYTLSEMRREDRALPFMEDGDYPVLEALLSEPLPTGEDVSDTTKRFVEKVTRILPVEADQ